LVGPILHLKVEGRTGADKAAQGQRRHVMHIGVGKATTIDELQIRWPGSAAQTFKGPIAVDQTYDVREGDTVLKIAAPPAVRIKQAAR